MMKNIVTIAICLMIAAGAFAQEKKFTWGVKAGLNISDLVGKDAKNTDMKIGYHFGVIGEYGFTEKFAIAPELVFSSQGTKQTILNNDVKLLAQYINLPIMAKYYVMKGLSINLGPQFGYAVSMKMKLDSDKEKLDSDTYKKFDVALGIGATYNFGKIFGDLRYNYGLTDVLKDGKNKNAVIQIGVGYKF